MYKITNFCKYMNKNTFNYKLSVVTFLFCLAFAKTSAQTVTGQVTLDGSGEALDFVSIYVKNTQNSTESSAKGNYKLKIKPDQEQIIVFRRVGLKEYEATIPALNEGATYRLDIALTENNSTQDVVVKARRIEDAGMIREKVNNLKLLPSASGNFESVLPAIALGTNAGSGGELSSQYNVRGGNYDENLVYVNDFEIYRPQLIRAGQQEGLSFPNINLIRELSFSSGGFEARYGDKLSSVLDIKYKRPDSLRSSVEGSLLGASAHIEGSISLDRTPPLGVGGTGGYRRFRYLVGARYKTTRYILGSLDVKGEYVPDFADIQTYLTYDLSRNWQLAFLGNYNSAQYRFTPNTRQTTFGGIITALQLSAEYEGSERDNFNTGMAGLSLSYIPEKRRNPLYLKFLTSTYAANEAERIDIIGAYSLGEIKTDLGSDNFGEVVAELGSGTQHSFVRNTLNSRVTNVEHKGGLEIPKQKGATITSSNFIQWGVKFQNEYVDDKLKEWQRLDSALYSLNYDNSKLLLYEYFKTQNTLSSNRVSAFAQNTYSYKRNNLHELQITAGVRAAYWDLNGDINITPRAQVLYRPLAWGNEATFRLAGGLYYQPPFYRELRNTQGIVNQNVMAQKSAHFVVGYSQDFKAFKSDIPFRFIMEAYYKKLWDLVSYDIENVRIRYAGANNATGYAYGLDARINGEFVKGAESWVNFSFLRTREQITGIQHLKRDAVFNNDTGKWEISDINLKDTPRPSDRFFNTSIFFQDYLRKRKNSKVFVNLTVGTGLPYGIPGDNIIYRNTLRFKAYHRIDIGFSYSLFNAQKLERNPNHFLRFTKSTWVSAEVFNLMEVANVASVTWIKTVFKQQYAVPNYLTSRRINLKLRMEF
jgi:hypothetical protein